MTASSAPLLRRCACFIKLFSLGFARVHGTLFSSICFPIGYEPTEERTMSIPFFTDFRLDMLFAHLG